jgi:hypothetical protein
VTSLAHTLADVIDRTGVDLAGGANGRAAANGGGGAVRSTAPTAAAPVSAAIARASDAPFATAAPAHASQWAVRGTAPLRDSSKEPAAGAAAAGGAMGVGVTDGQLRVRAPSRAERKAAADGTGALPRGVPIGDAYREWDSDSEFEADTVVTTDERVVRTARGAAILQCRRCALPFNPNRAGPYDCAHHTGRLRKTSQRWECCGVLQTDQPVFCAFGPHLA